MSGIVGLSNLGNTCFMNSALQCLSHTKELRELFLNKKIIEYSFLKNNPKIETSVTKEWVRLMEGMWKPRDNDIAKSIRPVSFRKAFIQYVLKKNIEQFRGFSQNDVQEFLLLIIDILHTSVCREVDVSITGKIKNDIDKMAVEAAKTWKNYFKSNYSEIITLFYGQVCSSLIHNKTNEVVSRSFDPICHFQLPIPDTEMFEAANIEPSLYDCFDLFTEEESLEGLDYTWKNKKIQVNKHMQFWKFPKILMITLKRFTNELHKSNTYIDFPLEELDVSDYCIGYEKDVIYDCYGVCNHSGGLRGGHYYAYCLCEDGQWREFNDAMVRNISKSNVISQHAYVLFYRKRE